MTIEPIVMVVLAIAQFATMFALANVSRMVRKFMAAQQKLNDANVDLWLAFAVKDAKERN